MHSVVTVIEPAKDISILTVKDAKLAMNLFATSSQSTDDQIEMFIRWASDVIGDLGNRVFAKETVKEQLMDTTSSSPRLPLSHFPIRTDPAPVVMENDVLLVEDVDYIVDSDAGFLVKVSGGPWLVPTVVEYTGGYDLPFEAPPQLQQAAILLTRESYNAAIRGDAMIRSISHKEARVMYFDPNALAIKSMASAGKSGTTAMRAAEALVQGLTRYWL
jgi:hypothetical protein